MPKTNNAIFDKNKRSWADAVARATRIWKDQCSRDGEPVIDERYFKYAIRSSSKMIITYDSKGNATGFLLFDQSDAKEEPPNGLFLFLVCSNKKMGPTLVNLLKRIAVAGGHAYIGLRTENPSLMKAYKSKSFGFERVSPDPTHFNLQRPTQGKSTKKVLDKYLVDKKTGETHREQWLTWMPK